MKRKEVLEIIENCIENHEQVRGRKELANVILTCIEESGMQPPYTGFYEEQDIVDRWGWSTPAKGNFVRVMANRWEPEDE